MIFPRNTGVPWLDSKRYELKNHLAFFGAYAELNLPFFENLLSLHQGLMESAAGREVLQVATGMPQRLYMTIFDPAGGRRVCLGYTYSFFEFWHPMESRMTDEEWKTIVYRRGADNRELWDKEPAWVGTLRSLE